jgi:hypothetical protein
MAEEREMAPKRALSNVTFTQELLDYFKPHRALQLVGFCVLYRLAGYPSPAALRNEGKRFFGLQKSAVYRCFVDLRRFRQHLLEQGYERVGVTDDASNTWELTVPALGEVVDRQMVDALAGTVREHGQTPAAPATVAARPG